MCSIADVRVGLVPAQLAGGRGQRARVQIQDTALTNWLLMVR